MSGASGEIIVRISYKRVTFFQDLAGQVELSTKRFADAQAFFDKQDGAN